MDSVNEVNNENLSEVKGNGNLKRKHGADASSDDENDFLGFDLGKSEFELQNFSGTDIFFFFIAEQNDSQHVIQNIKKICTDSSSDETTPRRQQGQQGVIYRTTDILDPAFKLPFKYGWKRELVSLSMVSFNLCKLGSNARFRFCELSRPLARKKEKFITSRQQERNCVRATR